MPFKPLYAKSPRLVLSQTQTLNSLVRKANTLHELQTILAQYLQPAIKDKCHIATFEAGTLTIIVNQAQWAVRLRYQQKRLLSLLLTHSQFTYLKRILIKVSPISSIEPEAKAPLVLSASAASALKDTAKTIQHPALKAALEKLAKHTN